MNEARQKGGLATLAKYNGTSHFQNIGRLGGRPPLKSISQQLAGRQAQAPVVPDGKKGGRDRDPTLKELRGLFIERYGK